MMKAIAPLGRASRNFHRETSNPVRRSVYNKFLWKGDKINRLSLTVPGRGCKSDTCVMCPLPSYKSMNASNENTFQQIKESIESYKGKIDMLSLYIDGSYYDQREIDSDLRNAIEDLIAINNISIYNMETLPSKFPEEEIIKSKERTNALLLINVGLQSSNSEIRKYCVGSPFTESDLSKMMAIKQRHDLKLRLYLLFKPPFLSESEAMSDIRDSIEYCVRHNIDIISVNPCKVSKGTLLEKLYTRNLYELSHYFSIAKALSSMSQISSVRVEMPSSDGCPGDVGLPHICELCGDVWKNGDFVRSFNANPPCWNEHMKHDSRFNVGKWQDRAEAFWASESYHILMERHDRK